MSVSCALVLILVSTAALAAVVSAGVLDKSSVPGYIDCVSSNDCGISECCVLGSARFSIPSCHSRGEVGDPCSPLSAPRNMSISYLDGSVVQLSGVFSAVCQCAPGLVCDRNLGSCADPLARQSLNDLDD